MTKEQALALYESGFWQTMTAPERAEFQLFEEKLCMPFGVFHAAVEEALGRPVYTHEFGFNIEGLRKELRGERATPTLEEIFDLIPADKRVILILPKRGSR